MKKNISLSICILLALYSCNSQNKTNQQDREATGTSKEKTICRKTIHIQNDFTQITSIGGLHIIYTQGDYRIEAEGDSSLLNYIEAEAESGILTLSLKGQKNTDINIYENKDNINVYVSCPDLKCVAICSCGDFTSTGIWRTDNLQLGILGSGDFNLDSIYCNSLDYQGTGSGSTKIRHINARDNIQITSMGEGTFTADINTNKLNAASHKGTIRLTGTAKEKDIYASPEELIIDNTH